ncbi:hypothetical protein [Spiroplasma tabanidicola]|uniref:Uncharacterized protein n=1 Tax=Spiroplasma tabanidicola TaxID=324079 RepID=A0A6I6C8K0_9MOLU|nr:hypothetical protein [Spiroplasma tabanidicola]QGS51779.1 hypothetical protein STABA_v1c04160 [Spiroplasma tabanidicola]
MLADLQHRNLKELGSSFYFTKLNFTFKNDENLAFFVNPNLIKHKVTNKYFRLLNYSVLSNDFETINDYIKNDFPSSKIKHLLKLVAKTTKTLFENRFKNQVDYENLFKLNIYCQLFLIYIRYNPNIWLKMDINNSKQIMNNGPLDWSIIYYIINYHVLRDSRFDLTKTQKSIINKLMSIDLNDNNIQTRDIIDEIVAEPILVIKVFVMQREVIKSMRNLRTSKRKYKHLLFSTAMQLIIHFINNNIDDYTRVTNH